VQQGAVGARDLGQRGEVLPGTGLVVDQCGAEHAHRAIGQRLLDAVRCEEPALVHRQLAQRERRIGARQGAGGGRDRGMAGRGYSVSGAGGVPGEHPRGHGAQGEIVRLGAAGGHEDPAARHPEQARDRLERLVQHRAGTAPRGVRGGGVAVHGGGREERLPRGGAQHGGRGVVEIGALGAVGRRPGAHHGLTGSSSAPPGSSSPSPPWASRLRCSSSSSFCSPSEPLVGASSSGPSPSGSSRVGSPGACRLGVPPSSSSPSPDSSPRASGSLPASSSASRRFSSTRSPLPSVVSESSLPAPPWPSPSPPPPPPAQGASSSSASK